MSQANRFADASTAVRFMLAGHARVTLVSQKTLTRFTYKITQGEAREGADPTAPDQAAPHFVKVLQGPDNGADYGFLGTIFSRRTYRHGHKSRIGVTAPSELAFAYAWRWLAGGVMPPLTEVWHEGTCGRCGRALTVPESIARGLGPECAGK